MTPEALAWDMEAREKARQLLKRYNEAKNKRKQYVPIWQEVANYTLPYRGGFYDVAPNTGAITTFDKHVDIYDDTAGNALTKAASAMYTYTANPATQWFNFTLVSAPVSRNKKTPSVADLLSNHDVKTYLEQNARIVCETINAALSTPLHGFCQELLAFAVSGFLVLEDYTNKLINIQPVSAKDLFILNDVYGGVGEVYRSVILTNEQAVGLFGQGLDASVLNDAQENPLKERVFIHAVLPRAVRDPEAKDKRNMPIASYWIDYQSRKVVLESGYEEFPYSVGRINVPAGYTYGFSPAMNVRHTIKSLNKLVKQKLNAGDLALTPAMNVPIDTYLNPLSMKPSALNYHEADAGHKAEPMHTIGNFQINIETIQDAREQVRQGLMIDLINQTDKDNTYQAMQEQLLQLRLMSPWQGNLERDALKPLIVRVYNILRRRGGILPQPPAELEEAYRQGVQLSIEYQSPLAKAQRHFDVAATERTLALGGQLAQVGGMEVINVEEAIRTYAELLGAPKSILYSQAFMRKKRKAEERAQQQLMEQQAQIQQAQMIQAGAQTARDAAQADQLSAQSAALQQGGM